MRRFPYKSLLAFGCAAFGALSASGCAENDSMMFVIGVYARKAGSCTATPDASAPILQRGTIDRRFASEYTAALLVGNQLTERGSREQLRTETSRVTLRGAEVRIERPEGGQLAEFSTIGTGFVDSASGTDPSYAIMYADLIPSSVLATLDDGLVVTKTRVFGTTLGGQDVESAELLYPIQICEGCLVSYPASAADPASPNSFRCRVATEGESENTDVDLPCQLGIDVAAPCTSCSNFDEACLSPDDNPYYQQP